MVLFNKNEKTHCKSFRNDKFLHITMLDQKLPKKRDKIFLFRKKKQTMDDIIFNAIFGFKRPKTSCVQKLRLIN